MSDTTMTREQIQAEINGLDNLMKQHDYIGTKIAMGQATKEEYAEQIKQSEEWAAKKDELEAQLAAMDETAE